MNTLVLNSSPLCRINISHASFPSPNPRARWAPLSSTASSFNNITIAIKSRNKTMKTTARRHKKISMQYLVPATDRVVAAVAYLLPFINGLQYGRFFFMQYPRAEVLFQPLFPILQAYEAVPYASFVAFFGLYLGVVRNPSFSRYVRFNAMQAVMADVLLSLPMIVQRILNPRGGLAFDLFVASYTGFFFLLVSGFLYAVASCILGRMPRVPFVADAADAQL